MTHQTDYLKTLKQYNVNLIDACKICYNKYHFEKYSLIKKVHIRKEDYIIKGKYRDLLSNIIQQDICSDAEFLEIISGCSQDDLDYIGI